MTTILTTSPFAALIIALILGTLLGIERTIAGKTAGLRTYGLVSMGACLFVILARAIAPVADIGSPGIMYVIAGIIMGIGFIGGGAIMHNHQHNQDHTSGLTTAAGLWVAAGIGATVGLGLVSIAIVATILTLIVFTLFWFLEHKVVDPIEKKLQ
jgi:putative Mg2+ transporter-C (MgtC) family protein